MVVYTNLQLGTTVFGLPHASEGDLGSFGWGQSDLFSKVFGSLGIEVIKAPTKKCDFNPQWSYNIMQFDFSGNTLGIYENRMGYETKLLWCGCFQKKRGQYTPTWFLNEENGDKPKSVPLKSTGLFERIWDYLGEWSLVQRNIPKLIAYLRLVNWYTSARIYWP